MYHKCGNQRSAEGGGTAKLARTRSGNLQAPGLVSNETALGTLAMALLVFQGEDQVNTAPAESLRLQY